MAGAGNWQEVSMINNGREGKAIDEISTILNYINRIGIDPEIQIGGLKKDSVLRGTWCCCNKGL